MKKRKVGGCPARDETGELRGERGDSVEYRELYTEEGEGTKGVGKICTKLVVL